MKNTFHSLVKNLPTLLTALAFALAVWIFAVTQADPTETRTLSRPVELEVIGQDPNLMIVNDFTEQVTLTVRGPSTVLDQLANDSSLITATLDLSGMEAGFHPLTPHVNIALDPVEVVRISPASSIIELDSIITQTFTIEVETDGTPAVGFEAKTPELSSDTVRISGPESLINSIRTVAAQIDIDEVSANVEKEVELTAYDAEGLTIDGLSLSPTSIRVTIPIEQRGGYRTVGVKPITSGELAEGYRLLNIFSIPPTVTIYSSNEALVESLPSSVETTPININDADETMEIRVNLDLPEGVNIVGSQYVTIRIEIEAIIDSRRFSDIPVLVEGLGEGLDPALSPPNVDVILEGPVALLDSLQKVDILIVVDLEGLVVGVYQVTPEVRLEDRLLTVESILPSIVEVTLN